MSRQTRIFLSLLLVTVTAAAGCHPTQPFYFHEDGDLSHLLEVATDIETPDLATIGLPDAELAERPLTLANPEFREIWDLSLEECVHIALQNTKTVRTLSGVTSFGIADGLVGRTGGSTIYDPAITESDPNSGVEAALSAFDAEFNTSLFWESRDRPQNFAPIGAVNNFFPSVLMQNQGTFVAELNKRLATGAQWFIRNRTIHDDGNSGGNSRAVPTTWEVNFELELRQPLLRGRGVQVNRVPVVLARINNDIALATFEANIRNMVLDIESAYWDLYCAYRAVETAKAGRDSAQATWQRAYRLLAGGSGDRQAEAQAREQYFFFRSALEGALGGNPSTNEPGLLARENRLRFLMGISPTDGRLIRPSDEPTIAAVEFEWGEIRAEALVRSAELRQQQWRIKQRELQLLQAKNQLLPQLDAVALYRWLGIGDHLAGGNGANFPTFRPQQGDFGGSTAFDELYEGDYQEARVGVQMTLPVGFRAELNGVRNVQLLLKREHAVLDDMQLNQIHLLTQAIRDRDANFQLAQTHFNRWMASQEEVNATQALFEGSKTTIDRVLDAQLRRSRAQIDFYRAVCEYNKSIATIHFRKGSLLDFNNIVLSEGPWPQKAYWDAMDQARQRDAGHYMNYGWSRPRVVSEGPVPQGSAVRGRTPLEPEIPAPLPAGSPDAELLPEPGPITSRPQSQFNASQVLQASHQVPAEPQDAFQWGGLKLSDEPSAEPPADREAPAARPAPPAREVRAASMANPLR